MKAVLIALLLAATGCAHYGRATPTSCHNKYIRDEHRSRGPHDTYETCMAKYERARDNPRSGSSGAFWTGAAIGAVVAAKASRPYGYGYYQQPTVIVVPAKPTYCEDLGDGQYRCR